MKKNVSKVPLLGPTREGDPGHFVSGLQGSSKSDFRYPTPRCMLRRLVVKVIKNTTSHEKSRHTQHPHIWPCVLLWMDGVIFVKAACQLIGLWAREKKKCTSQLFAICRERKHWRSTHTEDPGTAGGIGVYDEVVGVGS